MVGGAIVSVAGAVCATGSGAGGGNFTPASGFTISSPSGIANGSIVTVNANSGTPFGTKPFAVKPLLWAPFDTSASPSSLGRITTFLGNPVGGIGTVLNYQSSGGPTAGVGCLASTVTDGTSGVWDWAQGIDLQQWAGWAAADPFGGNNGYFANDLGQSIYTWRRVNHNFGHLDTTAAQSFNGIGGYNTKNLRYWSQTAGQGSAQATPDLYCPPSDQIFDVEFPTTLSTPPFQDYPSGGGSGQGAVTTAATLAAENQTNVWYAEELMTTSNSTNANYDANFLWRVPASPTQGPFTYGSIYQFPTTTYHAIGWQLVNSSSGNGQTLAGNLRGTMARIFPIHFVIDGTNPGHTSAPAGCQYFWSQVYCDDSPCRVMATNNATWGSETDFQIQIPTAWTGSSVSFSTYDLPLNWYLYVVNSSNSATQVGQRTS